MRQMMCVLPQVDIWCMTIEASEYVAVANQVLPLFAASVSHLMGETPLVCQIVDISY